MNKYTVRMYHYISGELHLVVQEFERLEHAIAAGVAAACHAFKVFDMDGCICHDSQGHNDGPYC